MLSLGSVAQSLAGVGMGDSLDLRPQTPLKTIETQHFEIQVPVQLMGHAKTVSLYLEQAYAKLSQFLKWKPKHKIYVYLIDNTDLGNGVTIFPFRQGLVLNLTPPDSWFTTTFYDDWLWMLIVHELTHYINMDPTEGWSEALRVVFGDLIRPNAAWPDWMLEGLATYIETKMTGYGRGRSSYYRMLSRAAVLEKTFGESPFGAFDQMVGIDPYFPSGQRPYYFGYQLMNQVVTDQVNEKRKRSHDGKSKLTSQDDVLGTMSIRSATRIPFFISGNLENLTSKGWEYYWQQWINERTFSAHRELTRIESQKITQPDWITKTGFFTLGHAVSPNGEWMGYNERTADDILGLWIKNLKTGKTRRIANKRQGVGMSFDPTGRFLFYTEIERHRQFFQYYDLKVYDLKKDEIKRLSHGYRAQDPDVSPIGDAITFVQRRDGGSRLMVASLKITKAGAVKLGRPRVLFEPKGNYDHVTNPKFSYAGDQVFFSFHSNGKPQKDILSANTSTGKIKTWVSDGAMNRFPIARNKQGVYFVSDRTGVDNLFKVTRPGDRPVMVTNVQTGIWLPSVFPTEKNTIVASTFTDQGWDLAKLKLNENGYRSIMVSPTPKIPEADPKRPKVDAHFEVENYAPLDSFSPRDWRPTFSFNLVRPVFGFLIRGFDSAFRNEYQFTGGYDFLTSRPDLTASYSNRSLGPIISLGGGWITAPGSVTVDGNGELTEYTRVPYGSLSAYYPIRYQFSTLTPSLSVSVQKEIDYRPDFSSPSASSPWVPIVATTFAYSGELASALAITQETGPYAILAGAAYFLPNQIQWKALARYVDYWRAWGHSVFVPSVTGAWTHRLSDSFSSANVILNGDIGSPPITFDSFRSNQTLGQLNVRGYPFLSVERRLAAIASMDFRFPIFRFYRGIGVSPYFFRDLIGYVFGETTVTHQLSQATPLLFPAAGGGLKLSTQFFNLPMTFGGEIQQGLDPSNGGDTQLVFSLRVLATNF